MLKAERRYWKDCKKAPLNCDSQELIKDWLELSSTESTGGRKPSHRYSIPIRRTAGYGSLRPLSGEANTLDPKHRSAVAPSAEPSTLLSLPRMIFPWKRGKIASWMFRKRSKHTCTPKKNVLFILRHKSLAMPAIKLQSRKQRKAFAHRKRRQRRPLFNRHLLNIIHSNLHCQGDCSEVSVLPVGEIVGTQRKVHCHWHESAHENFQEIKRFSTPSCNDDN